MSITGCRNDALVTLLNGFGYQPILLPRTGLTPPELYLYKNLRLRRRGPLSDYLPPATPMPALVSGQLSSIEHHETDKKNSSTAGTFLGDALKCIGITSAPKVDIGVDHGREVAFSFEDVTFDELEPSKIDHMLDTFLTGAIAKEDIEAGYLHIAYNYAYAGKLTMRTASSTSFSVNAKVIQVGAYVDLGTEGKATVESETTISFAGAPGVKAAFACKIGRLEKHGRRWELSPEEDAGDGFLADDSQPQPYLLERGVVFRVDED